MVALFFKKKKKIIVFSFKINHLSDNKNSADKRNLAQSVESQLLIFLFFFQNRHKIVPIVHYLDGIREAFQPHPLQGRRSAFSVGSLELYEDETPVGMQHGIVGYAFQPVVFVLPTRPALPPCLCNATPFKVLFGMVHSSNVVCLGSSPMMLISRFPPR